MTKKNWLPNQKPRHMPDQQMELRIEFMKLPWAQRERLRFISEMLNVYDFINRVHLVRKFEISTAQAALDFRTFQRIFPGWIAYDKKAKHFYDPVPF